MLNLTNAPDAPPHPSPDGEIPSGDSDHPALRLLRRGKIRAALDRAKAAHKSCPTPASEALLLRCYAARIRELRDGGYERNAADLTAFLAQAFPSWNPASVREPERPPSPNGGDAAQGGENAKPASPLDDALLRLADTGLSEEDRRAAEAVVSETAFDPLRLAGHPAFASEHPLAPAVRATAAAFSAVASRWVDEGEAALPEVPRRSPLAGWKLLIRTIAHLQRREDALASKALDSLAALKGAPARLVPTLRDVLAERWEGMDGTRKRIFAPWRTREKRFPGALVRLEAALTAWERELEAGFIEIGKSRRMAKELLASLRIADDAARLEMPDRLNHFRELAVAKAFRLTNLTLPEIEKGLGGPPARTASFWRSATLAMEHRAGRSEIREELAAVLDGWDAFRRHGAAEGLFAPDGPEAAEVYLRQADWALRHYADFGRKNAHGKSAFDMRYYYDAGQPEAVRALAPAPGDARLPFDPMYFFARALAAAPSTESFRTWLRAARRIESTFWKPKSANEESAASKQVFDAWDRALPNDPYPSILRMEEAEGREAYTLAQKYMAQAEAIDPLNADLTQAKWRLALAVCRRHLKQGKAKLVWEDIGKLTGLRRYGPKDAEWLFAALQWVVSIPAPDSGLFHQEEAADAEKRTHGELLRMTGDGDGGGGAYAARILEESILAVSSQVFHRAKYALPPPPPVGEAAVAIPGILRAIRLLESSGFPCVWSRTSRWPSWFVKAADALAPDDLPLILKTMRPGRHFVEMFALSARGLAGESYTAVAGRMLVIRARALCDAKTNHVNRIRQCLRAASEIGRRTGDSLLLEEATKLAKSDECGLGMYGNAVLAPMDGDEFKEVMRIERDNSRFSEARSGDPHSRARYRRALDSRSPKKCQCPDCRRARGELPDSSDDDDDDENNGDDGKAFAAGEALGALFPGGKAKELIQVLLNSGMSQEAAEKLAPILNSVFLTAMMEGRSPSAALIDFLRDYPILAKQVQEALDEVPAASFLPTGGRSAGSSADRRKAKKKKNRKHRGK